MPKFIEDKINERQRDRLEGYPIWASNMKMLKIIHKEIQSKKQAIRKAEKMAFRHCPQGRFA